MFVKMAIYINQLTHILKIYFTIWVKNIFFSDFCIPVAKFQPPFVVVFHSMLHA